MECRHDEGLREELAEDDADDSDDRGLAALREAGEPPPFAALAYPPLRFHGAVHIGAPPRAEVLGNIFANLLGAGFLVAPSAFARAGLLGGLAALAASAALSRRSLLLLLGIGGGVPGDRPYLELSRRTLGVQCFAGVLLAHLLYAGGLLAIYVAALADLLGQAARFTGAGGATTTPPRAVLVLGAVLLCTPGALTQSLRQRRWFGTACILSALLLVMTLLAACVGDLLPSWVPGSPEERHGVAEGITFTYTSVGGVLAAATLFTGQLSIHVGAIEALGPATGSAEEEMEVADAHGFDTGASLGHSRGARGGGRDEEGRVLKSASMRAYAAATSLVGALATVAYLRFGDKVFGDVLLSFRLDSHTGFLGRVMFAVARLVYGSAIVLAAAFVAVPCRNAALELCLVRRATGLPARTVQRASLLVLAACGCLVWAQPDLGVIYGIWSAWAAAPLGYVIPGALAMELARQRHRRAIASVANAPAALLVLAGVCMALSSLVGFARFALSPPAGHSGRRVVLSSLDNITTIRGIS